MINKNGSFAFWMVLIVLLIVLSIALAFKHNDLSSQIYSTTEQNIATNLASSSAVNFTQRKFDAQKGIVINNCQDVLKIGEMKLPNDYHITDQKVEPGKANICELVGPHSAKIPFAVMGTN